MHKSPTRGGRGGAPRGLDDGRSGLASAAREVGHEGSVAGAQRNAVTRPTGPPSWCVDKNSPLIEIISTPVISARRHPASGRLEVQYPLRHGSAETIVCGERGENEFCTLGLRRKGMFLQPNSPVFLFRTRDMATPPAVPFWTRVEAAGFRFDTSTRYATFFVRLKPLAGLAPAGGGEEGAGQEVVPHPLPPPPEHHHARVDAAIMEPGLPRGGLALATPGPESSREDSTRFYTQDFTQEDEIRT
jgi:hypothetical protein